MRKSFTLLLIVASVVIQTRPSPAVGAAGAERIEPGLPVLYDFAEVGGDTIHDQSGIGEPIDLIIEKPGRIRWSKAMSSIESATLIASTRPARKVIDAVKKSTDRLGPEKRKMTFVDAIRV